jgi:hypothetical protein
VVSRHTGPVQTSIAIKKCNTEAKMRVSFSVLGFAKNVCFVCVVFIVVCQFVLTQWYKSFG